MEKTQVISPLGGEIGAASGIASRLGTLSGKTVGEIWNGVFKGDQTFPLIRELLKRRYPDIKIIPYTEFPFLPGGDTPAHQKDLAKKIALLAKEKGCDAVISGNGA
jgi:hypothetical protein